MSASGGGGAAGGRARPKGRLILMRGLPGSGKSSLVKSFSNADIVSADSFFTKTDPRTGEEVYNYNPKQAFIAHSRCQANVKKFMEAGRPLIVVDNTNIDASSMTPYAKLAIQNDYSVEFREPTTAWRFDVDTLARRNQHGVTAEAIEKQLKKYDQKITPTTLLEKAQTSLDRAAKKQAALYENARQSALMRGASGGGGTVSSGGGVAAAAATAPSSAASLFRPGAGKAKASAAGGGNPAKRPHPSGTDDELDRLEKAQLDAAIKASLGEDSGAGAAPGDDRAKRRRVEDPTKVAFQLTAVPGQSERQEVRVIGDREVPYTTSLRDILRLNILESSVQFNYEYDLRWMVSQYHANSRKKPLLVVHGYDSGTAGAQRLQDDLGALGRPENIRLIKAPHLDQYGTHHTKMMLLFSQRGLRVVIGTPNMRSSDWECMTNAVWVSPIFPRRVKAVDKQDKCEEKPDTLGWDLWEYLSAYQGQGSALNQILRKVQAHDIGDVNGIRLVGSVPGRHRKESKAKWGHMKLRSLARCNLRSADDYDESEAGAAAAAAPPRVGSIRGERADFLVAQCSSIGSLGPEAKWLTTFKQSMAGGEDGRSGGMKFVWPTVEAVRTSSLGYSSGGSIPFAEATYRKQLWLRGYAHHWKAEWCERTPFSPHIKTFGRWSESDQRFRWLLLTSHNLSKAAWGELQAVQGVKNEQLFIRSYELGVFFPAPLVPLGVAGADDSASSCAPVPYDLPLERYGPQDEMWRWDGDWTVPDHTGKHKQGGQWVRTVRRSSDS